MANKFEKQPSEIAKKAVEKYVVTEGEDIGRMKIDNPAAESLARRMADREDLERTDEVYNLEAGPVHRNDEGKIIAQGYTLNDIQEERDWEASGTIGDEAFFATKKEVETSFNHEPEYRESDNKRSGYTKEFVQKLAENKKDAVDQAQKAKKEATEYYQKIREEQDKLAGVRKDIQAMGQLEQKSELTREQLANMQTLEVEIKADFSSSLEALNKATGANLLPRPDGYHLTIINPTESKVLGTLDDVALAELQKINKDIQNGDGVIVKGIGFIDGASSKFQMREVDKIKKTAFIALDIPALQAFRSKVGLPPKDFHVTLGFVGGDIHTQVLRQEPVKPGSPKMKDITAPILKQADSQFSAIILPEIKYGGLEGQMREQK